jgi:hypothetical protein
MKSSILSLTSHSWSQPAIDGEFLPVAGASAWVMKTNPNLRERVILIVIDENGVLGPTSSLHGVMHDTDEAR